ncbi:DUF4238 domain-containing protein, partial [Pelagicoccus sp. NFK12]
SEDKKTTNAFLIKHSKTVFGASIKSQCSEDYFYGKDSSVDDALTTMEGQVASLLEDVCDWECVPSYPNDDFIALLIFVSAQRGRTRQAKLEVEEMLKGFIHESLKDSPESLKDQLNQLELEIENGASKATAFCLENFPNLIDLKAGLVLNKTETEFITSDHPVVFYNQLFERLKQQGNTG